MINLDVARIVIAFSLMGLLAFLTDQAFRAWTPQLYPSGAREASYFAVRLGYGTVLSAGLFAILLLFVPSGWAVLSLGGLLLAAILTFRNRLRHRLEIDQLSGQQVIQQVKAGLRKDPLAVILTGGSFAFFGASLAYMRWPPPGDIMMLHGPITGVIATNGYAGLSERLWYFYPIGFHALPASLVGPLNLYPAEAVFVYGGFIAAIVPPVMYFLSRRLGARPSLAFFAFTAGFLMHPGGNAEHWILGPFFNGPYPNLFGYLAVLLVSLHQVDCLRGDHRNWRVGQYTIRIVPYLAILMVVYPSFAGLIGLHWLVVAGINRIAGRSTPRKDLESRNRNKVMATAIGGVLLLIVGTATILSIPTVQFALATWMGARSEDMLAYRLEPSMFVDNITGPVMMAGALIALRNILHARTDGLESFFLLLLGVLLLSLHPSVYSFLWPILPSRSLLILGILGWPLVLTEVTRLFRNSEFRHYSGPSGDSAPARTRTAKASAAFVITVTVLGLAQGLSGGMATGHFAPVFYGGFTGAEYFDRDFAAIEWLATHAGPRDLILTDGSFISRYIQSVAAVRISHDLPIEFLDRTLFYQLDRIWMDPFNETYISQTLAALGVRFILSASEPAWWRFREATPWINQSGYFAKPFPPSVYASTLEGYPFLRIEYTSGDTRVFSVVST